MLEQSTASRKGDRSATLRHRVRCTTVGDSPDRGRSERVLVPQLCRAKHAIWATPRTSSTLEVTSVPEKVEVMVDID